MSGSFRSLLLSLVLSVFLVLASSAAQAQSQAACTFKLFQLNSSNNPSFQANGVNDYGTVVGQALFSPPKGFIRYAGGGVSYFAAPNSATTSFLARNDGGVNVGFYSTQGANSNISKGFILQGSTFTSFVHPKAVWGTELTGINKYNSAVGWYLDSSEFAHGFKRFSNGGLAAINFPGAQSTFAIGINDSGTIAGFYSNPNEHGFIYHNGQWATVDYPNTSGTEVYGISNGGVVIGLDHSLEQGRAFMFANGTFKVISVPNSFYTHALGIAPNGLITGMVVLNGSSTASGFTATCK
jgi:hypothetical protein